MESPIRFNASVYDQRLDEPEEITSPYLQIGICAGLFVGNAVLLIALRKATGLKFVTTLFIGHIAVADFLQGMGATSRAAILLLGYHGPYSCMAAMSVCIMSGGATVSGMVFLYIELYLSLKKMAILETAISRKVAIWMVVVGWVGWTIAAFSIFLVFNYVETTDCFIANALYTQGYLLMVSVLLLVHLVVILLCQVAIVIVIRQHFKVLLSSQMPATSQSMRERWLRKRVSMSKTIAVVAVLFCSCWYPFSICLFLFAFCPETHCGVGESALAIMYSGILVHSILNVPLYAWKSAELRAAFVDVACCCVRGRGNAVGPVSSGGHHTQATQQAAQTPDEGQPGPSNPQQIPDIRVSPERIM